MDEPKWSDPAYCRQLVTLLSYVFAEIECDLSNKVVGQSFVASETRQAMKLDEQQQAALIAKQVQQTAAFLPIAASMQINFVMSLVSLFAQECGHPELLEAIKEHNLNAI